MKVIEIRCVLGSCGATFQLRILPGRTCHSAVYVATEPATRYDGVAQFGPAYGFEANEAVVAGLQRKRIVLIRIVLIVGARGPPIAVEIDDPGDVVTLCHRGACTGWGCGQRPSTLVRDIASGRAPTDFRTTPGALVHDSAVSLPRPVRGHLLEAWPHRRQRFEHTAFLACGQDRTSSTASSLAKRKYS